MNNTLLFLLIFIPLFTLFGMIIFRRFGKPKRIRAVVLDKEMYTDSKYRCLRDTRRRRRDMSLSSRPRKALWIYPSAR